MCLRSAPQDSRFDGASDIEARTPRPGNKKTCKVRFGRVWYYTYLIIVIIVIIIIIIVTTVTDSYGLSPGQVEITSGVLLVMYQLAPHDFALGKERICIGDNNGTNSKGQDEINGKQVPFALQEDVPLKRSSTLLLHGALRWGTIDSPGTEAPHGPRLCHRQSWQPS